MRLAVYPYFALVACGHGSGKPPAAPARAAASAADLAGAWTASDDLDFAYQLTIAPDGTLDLWIDRNRLGRCEEKGKLVPEAAAGSFSLTYRVDDCHRSAIGKSQDVHVESFTGDALTIAIGELREDYRRAR